MCGECVFGNEKARSHPVSFPVKSTESPISDSGHIADLLMETDGLSSGVYLPPPPQQLFITKRLRLQIH